MISSKELHKRLVREIYKFDCYREFLGNFFKEMKKLDKAYTIQNFSHSCGFKNHSYLVLVIQGKRKLTLDGFLKLNSQLKLDGKYKKYFNLLVMLSHATSSEKKTDLYNKLQDEKKTTSFYSPKEKQYKYFEKWFYPVIRSLVVNSNWAGNYKKLANMCFPKVSKREAEKAVGDLISFGLIKKVNTETYVALENRISDEDVPVFIKKKGRLDIIENNKEALDKLEVSERYSTYNTWATSERSYKEIIKLFEEFREKANEIVDKDDDIDRVYNMLFQVFPNSINVKEEK